MLAVVVVVAPTSLMGDQKNDGNSKTAPFLLPPGCRFYPSEEELLRYYLTNKNANANNTDDDGGYNLIKELDLYDYEPKELLEKACYAYGFQGKKRHGFCYSKARVKEKERRRAKNGFWRRRGRVKDIVGINGGEKVVVGTRKRFVFYFGNSPENAVSTDWVLYEYQLVDHVKAAFVLCRVFVKSRSGNSVSEIGISSAMEESVSAVRHIGVQHDGSLTSSLLNAELHDNKIIDGRLVSQLDNRVMLGPPVANFQLPMDIPSSEQVSTSGLTSGDMFVDTLPAQQLLAILEEDFIELDDLVP